MQIAGLILCGLTFYSGMAISTFAHAQASIAARSNGLTGFREYFSHNWVSILMRTFLATIFLPLMIAAVPASVASILPRVSVYGLVGISSDSLLSPIVFMLGQKFGKQLLAPEMPEAVPPSSNPTQEQKS